MSSAVVPQSMCYSIHVHVGGSYCGQHCHQQLLKACITPCMHQISSCYYSRHVLLKTCFHLQENAKHAAQSKLVAHRPNTRTMPAYIHIHIHIYYIHTHKHTHTHRHTHRKNLRAYEYVPGSKFNGFRPIHSACKYVCTCARSNIT
jgi:hypothetical protein